jgi:hypothetical protein
VQLGFDPSKDATKSEQARPLLGGRSWDAALVWIDDRADYGEVRMVALAPIGDMLLFQPL